jgi:hypothetical protein
MMVSSVMPVSVQGQSAPTPQQKDIINKTWHYLNPNSVNWNTYHIPPHLPWFRRACIKVITDFYQYHTRGAGRDTLIGKYMRKKARTDTRQCVYQRLGRLSCSEFTTVLIAELGVRKGIKAFRSRTQNYDFAHNQDPLFVLRKRSKHVGKPYFEPILA